MKAPFQIKICGVCTARDAEMICAAGADAIGLNFFSQSPRFLSAELAKEIAQATAKGVARVGVFVNPSERDVRAAFDQGLIDWAQFHGDESNEFCQQFAPRSFKAIRIGSSSDVQKISTYTCETVLVDTATSLYGGSGVALQESWAMQANGLRSIILAGGLTPENVAAKIAQIRPAGVDVASGVESKPREKSESKVRNFIDAAKQAFRQIGQ